MGEREELRVRNLISVAEEFGFASTGGNHDCRSEGGCEKACLRVQCRVNLMGFSPEGMVGRMLFYSRIESHGNSTAVGSGVRVL